MVCAEIMVRSVEEGRGPDALSGRGTAYRGSSLLLQPSGGCSSAAESTRSEA